MWEALTKFSASAILLVSATCYLSAYLRKELVLSTVGLKGSVIQVGVQDTIANGFIGVFLTATALYIAVNIVFYAANMAHRLMRTGRSAAYRSINELFNFANIVIGMITIAFVAYFGAMISEKMQMGTVYAAISGNCREHCFQYVLTQGQVYGVMIEQSSDRAVIVSRSAAYVVDNKDIKYARPIGSSRSAIRNAGL